MALTQPLRNLTAWLLVNELKLMGMAFERIPDKNARKMARRFQNKRILRAVDLTLKKMHFFPAVTKARYLHNKQYVDMMMRVIEEEV